jgi:hypothetical protein
LQDHLYAAGDNFLCQSPAFPQNSYLLTFLPFREG